MLGILHQVLPGFRSARNCWYLIQVRPKLLLHASRFLLVCQKLLLYTTIIIGLIVSLLLDSVNCLAFPSSALATNFFIFKFLQFQISNFNFKLQLQTSASNFNFKLQFQTATSNFNFKIQLQTSTSNFKLQTSNFSFKPQYQALASNFNFNFQPPVFKGKLFV